MNSTLFGTNRSAHSGTVAAQTCSILSATLLKIAVFGPESTLQDSGVDF